MEDVLGGFERYDCATDSCLYNPCCHCVSWGIFLKSRRDERIENHKVDIENQLETKKLDIQNSENIEKDQAHIKTLEIVRDIVLYTQKAERVVYKELLEESRTADVSIDNVSLSTTQLSELARSPRGPRAEARTKVIEDHFIVSIIDFSSPEGTLINLKGTVPEHEFKNVIIPDDLLNDEEMAFFSNAQGRIPMHLRLTVKEKRGILSDPTLIQKM